MNIIFIKGHGMCSPGDSINFDDVAAQMLIDRKIAIELSEVYSVPMDGFIIFRATENDEEKLLSETLKTLHRQIRDSGSDTRVIVLHPDIKLETLDLAQLESLGLRPIADSGSVPMERLNETFRQEVSYIQESRTDEDQVIILDSFSRISNELMDYGMMPVNIEVEGSLHDCASRIKEKKENEMAEAKQHPAPAETKQIPAPPGNKQIPAPPANKQQQQSSHKQRR